MKRILGVVLGLVLGTAALAGAQESMGFFRSPTFVWQPGLIMSFADEAKRGPGANDPHFNMRFVTAIPTSIPRTTLVAIIQWTPLNDPDGDGAHGNSPGFVYGPVVNVVNARAVSFDIDALFAYTPTGSNPSKSDYTHKFLIEGDLFIKIGSMMGMGSHWNSLSLYGLLAYIFTGIDDPPSPAEPIESGDRLVLLAGLSLPLAPWKK